MPRIGKTHLILDIFEKKEQLLHSKHSSAYENDEMKLNIPAKWVEKIQYPVEYRQIENVNYFE